MTILQSVLVLMLFLLLFRLIYYFLVIEHIVKESTAFVFLLLALLSLPTLLKGNIRFVQPLPIVFLVLHLVSILCHYLVLEHKLVEVFNIVRFSSLIIRCFLAFFLLVLVFLLFLRLRAAFVFFSAALPLALLGLRPLSFALAFALLVGLLVSLVLVLLLLRLGPLLLLFDLTLRGLVG